MCILAENAFQATNGLRARIALHLVFAIPASPRALRDGLHGGGLYIA